MERGKFEHSVAQKFSGKGAVPRKINWDRVETALNQELVISYAESNRKYRLISIAAAIAILLLSIGYFLPSTQESSLNDQSVSTYNALLEPDYTDNYFEDNTAINPFAFSIPQPRFVLTSNKTVSTTTPDENLISREDDAKSMDPLKLQALKNKKTIQTAPVNYELDRYRQPGYSMAGVRRTDQSNEIWAGIEAGAGTFNPEFSGEDALSTVINASALETISGVGFSTPSATTTQNDMTNGISTSLGMNFGMKLSDKWTIESGLSYANIQNSMEANLNVIDVFSVENPELVSDEQSFDSGFPAIATQSEPQVEVEDAFNSNINLENTIQFASVPVKAGYFLVENKFLIRLNAGFSANYFISNSISDPSGSIETLEPSGIYNDWSFDGLGGVEFGYSLFDKFDLTVAPNYRHAIRPLSASISRQSGFNLMTGIRYTLR
jgi:hypothetical protein